MNEELVVLTRSFLRQTGHWSNDCLVLAGIPVPPKKGWKKTLVGKSIPKSAYLTIFAKTIRLPDKKKSKPPEDGYGNGSRWWAGFVREMRRCKPCYAAELEDGHATVFDLTTGKSFGVLHRVSRTFRFHDDDRFISTANGYGLVVKRLKDDAFARADPYQGNLSLKAKTEAGLVPTSSGDAHAAPA